MKLSPAALFRRIFLLAACALAPSGSQASAAADWKPPTVVKPSIGTRTFKITDFGAVADGKTLDSPAIQKAIDSAAAAGGGVVTIPAGTFLTAAIRLASGIEFHLDQGATLLFSNKQDDYQKPNNRFENLLTADKCHDIAITGQGTINGQGQPWWDQFSKAKGSGDEKSAPHRPYMVVIHDCQRVLVQGVTLTNSPSFHLVPAQCQDVTIDGVTFVAPARAPNTDALDPSGWNFLITGCTFDVGDDCIAIKASGKPEGDKASCEDFLVTNCTFKHGHGMSIGGQTPGGLKRLVVKDSTFENTDAGIRMKAPRGAGGLVEDCLYTNLTMKDVKVPIYITSYYPENTAPKTAAADPAKPFTTTTPIWRNIRITNVTSTGSPSAGRLLGLAEMPISNIEFTNVKIEAGKGMDIWNCEKIHFVSSQIVAKGPALNVQESKQVAGIDPQSGRPE